MNLKLGFGRSIPDILLEIVYNMNTHEAEGYVADNTMVGCTYGGRYLRSKRTLKKILRLPELNPSITVLTKDSPRTLFR